MCSNREGKQQLHKDRTTSSPGMQPVFSTIFLFPESENALITLLDIVPNENHKISKDANGLRNVHKMLCNPKPIYPNKIENVKMLCFLSL